MSWWDRIVGWAAGAGAHSAPDPAVIEAREAAYASAFGCEPSILHAPGRARPHVDVYAFPPGGDRDYTTLITGGMSDLPMPGVDPLEDGACVELAMCVGGEWRWAAELLWLVAGYPFTNDTWLGAGHTIALGPGFAADAAGRPDASAAPREGEAPECALSSVLLLEPVSLPATLCAPAASGERARRLQVILITDAELELAQEQGSSAVAPLLIGAGYHIVRDVYRASTVPGMVQA